MDEIINLAMTNGLASAIVIYFLYKDYKFNDQILHVLSEVQKVLAVLETWHAKEE